MSKWYEITTRTTKSFLIEVEDNEDEEQAMQVAMDEVMFSGDSEAWNEGLVKEILVDNAKRLCDEVIPL